LACPRRAKRDPIKGVLAVARNALFFPWPGPPRNPAFKELVGFTGRTSSFRLCLKMTCAAIKLEKSRFIKYKNRGAES
jgi:hypothetical protein